MQPGIARIAAFEKRRQCEAVVDLRRNVFEAVHGEIDMAANERLFELFDEEPFSADGRERDFEAHVAASADLLDLDDVSGALEPQRDFVRLPHRQRRAAGSNSYSVHRRPKIFLIVRRSDSRSCGSSDESLSCRIG